MTEKAAGVQRKTSKELQKAWRTTAQLTNNYKTVKLLGSII